MKYRLISIVAIFAVIFATGCVEPEDGEGDDRDVVEISEDITTETTWKSDSIYRVTEEVEVSAPLTIEPGTVIEFEAFAGLVLSDEFDIRGTEEEQILFTGTEEEPGHWKGILIRQTKEDINGFDHVVIEYGGGDAYHSSQAPANLQLARDGSGGQYGSAVALTNSTLRHSGGHGLSVQWRGWFHDFENNVFVDNEEAPVRISDNRLHSLDTDSEYEGNGVDAVIVDAYGTGISNSDVTWENLGIPYRFQDEDHNTSEIRVTIEPGTVIEFEQLAGLTFGWKTEINLRGTEEEPIVFTGTEEEPGHWNGLWIDKTTEDINALEHVVVEYGGNTSFFSEPANLTIARSGPIQNDASVEVTDSTFAHSGGYGIVYEDTRASVNGDIDSANEFEGNESGDIHVVE